MWLRDDNTGAYAEIGYYSGYPSSYGVTSYFYGYIAPGGSYQQQFIQQVSPPDKGGYTSFKITRNRQTTSTLLVAAVSVGYYINYSAVISDNQGGTTWAGNDIQIGSRLYANSSYNPSSNGTISWTANDWQAYNGGNGQYIAQTTDGNMTQDAYQHPYWQVHPYVQGSNGGTFANSCCYP